MDEVTKTAAAIRQFYRESLEAPDGSQRNLEKSFPLFIGDNTHNRVIEFICKNKSDEGVTDAQKR